MAVNSVGGAKDERRGSFLYRCLTFDKMTEGEVAGVRYHSYHVRGSTLLHPMMNLFWEWLVTKVPHWLSSNLLTSAGLVLNIVTGLLFVHYCPTATEEAPGWLYLFACVSAFTYQTLDCIDGKHQFRTGCNNDVAEIFDHGFDAVSNSLLAVEMACMLQIGSHPNLVLVFELATVVLFYETQWLNYITGYMNFGK
ncbi:choline/ethanolaminephosphotransferase 1-like [Diadema antillarum]|uniref:choline/ethanolaminephosphotransferase 1-like n=1 Tax=Diadema antillarum TaxID=105358 RepID=UPI003A8A9637